MGHAVVTADSDCLLARLARCQADAAGGTANMARWLLLCRPGDDLAGDCIAAGCAGQLVAAGPHGAASVADVRGAPAAAAGRADGATAARVAARLGARRAGAAVHVAHTSRHCALHCASGDRLDRDELAYLGWHVPAAYELALRSPGWHEVEHACFLFTSLLFWWTVVQPWPSRAHGRAGPSCPIWSARTWRTPRSRHFSPSRIACSIPPMPPRRASSACPHAGPGCGWRIHVGGGIGDLPGTRGRHHDVAAFAETAASRAGARSEGRRPRERFVPFTFDLLRVPVVGALLHARYGRQSLQADQPAGDVLSSLRTASLAIRWRP